MGPEPKEAEALRPFISGTASRQRCTSLGLGAGSPSSWFGARWFGGETEGLGGSPLALCKNLGNKSPPKGYQQWKRTGIPQGGGLGQKTRKTPLHERLPMSHPKVSYLIGFVCYASAPKIEQTKTQISGLALSPHTWGTDETTKHPRFQFGSPAGAGTHLCSFPRSCGHQTFGSCQGHL